ncbi:Diaminopimelate epimerase [Elusimicrobium minutum Pei191]|uniref:Diaminopimelate epimerase n=1 Tax=Elusimicrobium minutum (strain Pei191) TaxID=445932 RepID=DAPF_ELUMP|nr:diaminopimelate epimerase [Elusimicrobium minutum]B2KDH2.1 RecName: Full=Diaminopimelate epimerase; Short=DAP epimerase; AltName: Full=PLP-independent amino acid racemase [Elusimicrobium minutum Pei191]ACC98568.1 Diaminopimelate epimerase [Elusimicrobium minutum Pei191]
MEFVKYQGLGNDFILIDCVKIKIDGLNALGKKLCDRHFGIGADGLIAVFPSASADYKIRIINSDGTEPEMCGNGIRCAMRFVFDYIKPQRKLTFETLAGPIKTELLAENLVKVDMGAPKLTAAQIPLNISDSDGRAVDIPVKLEGGKIKGTGVSMGNPHFVIFVEDIKKTDVAKTGKEVENNTAFPQKTNVEFVQVITPSRLCMKVWERGVGITLACGTGACASLVAGVLNNKTERLALVELDGGQLTVEWPDDGASVFMTGPATEVFSGVFKE